jgi:23S rRNA (cytosine1962-C5)-methyltransferase
MLHSKITTEKGKRNISFEKHPWVFSGAISTIENGVKDATIVEIVSWDKSFLGMGHYQSGSSIAIRIISFEPTCNRLEFLEIENFSKLMRYRKAVNLPNQKLTVTD